MTTAEVAFYTGAKSSNRARMEGTVLEGTVTGCQGRTKVDSHRQFQVRMGQSKSDFPAFDGELFSKLSAPDETDSSDVHGSVESGRNKGLSRLLVEVKGWVSEEHNRCSLTTPGHFQGCFQGASRKYMGYVYGDRGPWWVRTGKGSALDPGTASDANAKRPRRSRRLAAAGRYTHYVIGTVSGPAGPSTQQQRHRWTPHARESGQELVVGCSLRVCC